MEFEFIKEAVEVDATSKRTGKWVDVIRQWLETDNKTLKFSCKSMGEKKNCYASCTKYIKQNKLNIVVYIEKRSYNIYLIRG